jgi:hypothetical protein
MHIKTLKLTKETLRSLSSSVLVLAVARGAQSQALEGTSCDAHCTMTTTELSPTGAVADDTAHTP